MIRKHKNLVKFWELEVAKPTQPYPETIVGTNEGGDWERIMSSNEKWAQSADEMAWSKRIVTACTLMEYMSRFVDIRLYKAESSAECGKEGAEFDLFHGYVQRISSSWEENEEQVWSKLFPAIELKEATVSAAKHGKMLGRCYRCRRSYCARVQNSLNSIMVLDTSGCGNSSPCKDSAQSCRGRLLYLLRILKSDFDALQSTAIVTYQTEVSTVIQMLRRYLTEEEYTSAFRDLVDKSFAEMEDAGARAFHVEPPVEPRQGGQECVPCISKF